MGSRKTDETNRARLRKTLRARGVPEDEIDRLVAEKAAVQKARREAQGQGGGDVPMSRKALEREEYERWYRANRHVARPIEDGYVQPDDSKHRPATPDPLTRGRARVTGLTAKAVRRSKAMTKHEWDEANRQESA